MSIIFLSAVLPILTYYLSKIQYIWIGHSIGSKAITELSMTEECLILPRGLIGLSNMICLVMCGMRIASKRVLVKKGITILSIVSVSGAIFSVFVAIITLFFFWEPIWYLYTNVPMDGGPIIPINHIASMVGYLSVAIIFLVTGRTKRINIEVILAVFVAILPSVSWILMFIQNCWIISIDATSIVRLGITSTALKQSIGLMGMVSSLCLVICGMRIAHKDIQKKQRTEEINVKL